MQARTATSPNSTRRQRGGQRLIELSWSVADEMPGMRQLAAECPDEITSWTFAGPAIFDENRIEELLSGEMGAMAIEDHIGRCEACQAWQARAA
jgi:hypothetical protein